MRIYGVFVMILAVIAAVVTGAWLHTSYQSIVAANTEELKAQSVSFFEGRIKTSLDPGVFASKDKQKQAQALQAFWYSIQSPDVVRIKAWDMNYTVLWSNSASIIGQRFADNRELGEALKGEPAFEIGAAKNENISEEEFQGLSETYVPVKDTGGAIVGAMEIYQSTVPFDARVGDEFRKQELITIPLAILAFVAAAFLLRLVIKPKSNP